MVRAVIGVAGGDGEVVEGERGMEWGREHGQGKFRGVSNSSVALAVFSNYQGIRESGEVVARRWSLVTGWCWPKAATLVPLGASTQYVRAKRPLH